MKHREFTREFKFEVLRDMNTGKSIVQVCRENDLKPDLVYRWRHEYRKDPGNAFAGHGKIWTLEGRNSELERLVGKLYAENTLLKKALERLQHMQAERR